MRDRTTMLAAGIVAGALAAAPAWAEKVTFSDPAGDDNGPGNYVYPTDAVYSPGSFDLVELEVEDKGKNVDFSVEVNSKLDDPWGMGVGFAVQMIFIFIDTDGATGSGHTDGLPGLNISFDPAHAWEKVVVLSPQQQSRVMAEARVKLPEKLAAGDVLVPRRTLGKGKSISGRISKEDIGSGDATASAIPMSWTFSRRRRPVRMRKNKVSTISWPTNAIWTAMPPRWPHWSWCGSSGCRRP